MNHTLIVSLIFILMLLAAIGIITEETQLRKRSVTGVFDYVAVYYDVTFTKEQTLTNSIVVLTNLGYTDAEIAEHLKVKISIVKKYLELRWKQIKSLENQP